MEAKMSNSDNLAGDLLNGMASIAHFVGMDERRCYFLATRGMLPGVFKQGGQWIGLKSKIREGYERAAEQSQKSRGDSAAAEVA
jgi:hypothetical protein